MTVEERYDLLLSIDSLRRVINNWFKKLMDSQPGYGESYSEEQATYLASANLLAVADSALIKVQNLIEM